MDLEFDMSELTETAEKMYDMVTQRWPKENNKWMRKQGREGRKIAAGIARQRIKNLRPASNKKSYMARLKGGKPYHYLGDPTDLSVRTYNSAPHAHLIEYGHKVKPRGKTSGKTKNYQRSGSKPNKKYDDSYQRVGSSKSFVAGYHILEDAEQMWEKQFEENLSQHLDGLLERGLF